MKWVQKYDRYIKICLNYKEKYRLNIGKIFRMRDLVRIKDD